MDELQIRNILEAALLTAGEPVAVAKLAKLFDPPLESTLVTRLLEELAQSWTDRSVELGLAFDRNILDGKRSIRVSPA